MTKRCHSRPRGFGGFSSVTITNFLRPCKPDASWIWKFGRGCRCGGQDCAGPQVSFSPCVGRESASYRGCGGIVVRQRFRRAGSQENLHGRQDGCPTARISECPFPPVWGDGVFCDRWRVPGTESRESLPPCQTGIVGVCHFCKTLPWNRSCCRPCRKRLMSPSPCVGWFLHQIRVCSNGRIRSQTFLQRLRFKGFVAPLCSS